MQIQHTTPSRRSAPCPCSREKTSQAFLMSKHYAYYMTTKPAPAVRAAIYCRISKDREGAGLGVQRQEEDCREVAQALGWEVAHVFVDNDISAFSGKARPQYRALLEAMRRGIVSRVIAWHTDRLHRSPRELEEYIDLSEKHGIATHTARAGEIDLSTPSGRAVARTLGAWARYESEHKSERIVRKKLQLAQAGAFSGGPVPFGWVLKDKEAIVVEADAAEIRKAIEATIAGASIGSIVKDLNARCVSTRRGQKWTSTSVRNLLLRPTNAGLSAYRGEVVGISSFPPIITEDQWRAVCAIITNPSRRSQTDSRVKHLLAGLLRCGNCGGAMKTSSRAGGGTSRDKFYYKCPSTGSGHAFQMAEPVEHLISETVIARLNTPGVLARLNDPRDAEQQHALQSEAATLRARMDEAADSFADGLTTRKQLETINQRVGSRLEAISHDLAIAARASVVPSTASENVRGWWEAAGLERQRAVIDALMVPIVDPIRRSAPRVFDPNRVRIEWKVG
ncbi:recombinase family protein [Pseudarthrobacter oxydans]|uniref:recombinase family protein n=1 Tax=Pseudarthrobacter oxydans TaxID=1671 RepID=UPI002AA86059|nr:recombinase family protein [Pseudarthrobacter oxydans]WPU08104.1 recombinase family protein [Pseudarthrobacter oxydans]